MHLRALLVALSAAFIAACKSTTPVAVAPPPPPLSATEANMPGSARDAHGCVPSAGYTWCTREQGCRRPWELAKAQGIASTREAFDQYCQNPAASTQIAPTR